MKTIKLTDLQDAIIDVIRGQPYGLKYDKFGNEKAPYRNYYFSGNERRSALRLEKRKLIRRIDKTGNKFKLTSFMMKNLNKIRVI